MLFLVNNDVHRDHQEGHGAERLLFNPHLIQHITILAKITKPVNNWQTLPSCMCTVYSASPSVTMYSIIQQSRG